MKFYLCNRKKCKDCNDRCRHTSSPLFALNRGKKDLKFMEIGDHLWEMQEIKPYEGKGLH